jgi:hypothetical protein
MGNAVIDEPRLTMHRPCITASLAALSLLLIGAPADAKHHGGKGRHRTCTQENFQRCLDKCHAAGGKSHGPHFVGGLNDCPKTCSAHKNCSGVSPKHFLTQP